MWRFSFRALSGCDDLRPFAIPLAAVPPVTDVPHQTDPHPHHDRGGCHGPRRQRGPGSGGASGHGFRPGRSGNPGGRSKTQVDIQALAQRHGPEAIQTLAAALKSRNERVRVAAAAILLAQPKRGNGCATPARQNLQQYRDAAGPKAVRRPRLGFPYHADPAQSADAADRR